INIHTLRVVSVPSDLSILWPGFLRHASPRIVDENAPFGGLVKDRHAAHQPDLILAHPKDAGHGLGAPDGGPAFLFPQCILARESRDITFNRARCREQDSHMSPARLGYREHELCALFPHDLSNTHV